MKRYIENKCNFFSIFDDKGSAIGSNKNELFYFDSDSKILNIIKFSQEILFLNSKNHTVVGFNGSIILIDSNYHQIQYLFPVGFESIPPKSVSFNKTQDIIAISASNSIFIFNLKFPIDSSLIAVLEGHDYFVSHCEFMIFPGLEHILITCAEDNRFIIWDLNKRALSFESPYESSVPLIGISVFSSSPLFYLIFQDGFIRIHDCSPIAFEKPSIKYLKTLHFSNQQFSNFEEEEESIIISKSKNQKLIPKNIEKEVFPFLLLSHSVIQQQKTEFLLISSNLCIYSININTFEKKIIQTFEVPIIECYIRSLFIIFKVDNIQKIELKKITISFLPEIGVYLFPNDIPEKSLVNKITQPKTKKTIPIATLHKNIKSSGYNSKLLLSKNINKTKLKSKKDKEDPIMNSFDLPKGLFSSINLYNSPVIQASLSSNGKRLITSDNSGTIIFVKPKLTSYPAYLGHKQPVTSLSWSSKNFFISSSNDKTVKVWDIDRPDPLLTISTIKSSEKQSFFPEEITCSSFLWKDQFITLSSGKELFLYGYSLPKISNNNIQEMHQTGSYKLISNLSIENGKILSFSCSNLPQSPVIITANTNRSLSIIDIHTFQQVFDISTQHEKPIHSIIGSFGGIYTTRVNNETNYILSGSTDETFKLWDLRSTRCERTFIAGSRTKKVGSCFSPDSKYIALGTERSGIEIWDVSMGSCLMKIKDDFRGMGITWLQWNPSSGRLQSTTDTGLLKIFE